MVWDAAAVARRRASDRHRGPRDGKDGLRVDPRECRAGICLGGIDGPLGGVVYLVLNLLVELLVVVDSEQSAVEQVLTRPRHGVLLPPRLDLLGRAVCAVVVVGGVRKKPVGLAFDESGPTTLSCQPDRGAGGFVDRERIVTVNDHTTEAVRPGSIGDMVDSRLQGHRYRDGVLVVLTDQHERQTVDAGVVQGLVKVALRRRRLPEVTHGDRVVAADLCGPREPGGMRDLGGDRRRAGDDAEAARAPVARHLAAAGVGVVRTSHHVEEDLVRRHSHREHDADVAVIGQHHVVAPPQRPCRADLRRFLPRARDDESGLSGAGQVPALLVDCAGQKDRAVHGDDVVVSKAQVRVAVQSVGGR